MFLVRELHKGVEYREELKVAIDLKVSISLSARAFGGYAFGHRGRHFLETIRPCEQRMADGSCSLTSRV